MKSIEEIKANGRFLVQKYVEGDGGYGFLYLPSEKKPATVIFSCGGGWDHVSISMKKRCPTWDEMCLVKEIFFNDNEWVVEFHPAKEEYVNFHPYCLHLWKPQKERLPVPSKIFV